MAPLKLALLFCTVKVPPLGPQLTVPALVSASAKYSVPLPVTFITPLLAMVKGLPPNDPPDQLNWPSTVTGPVRLIVPLLKLMLSPDAGTPTGVQLFALNQSLLAEPFHVLLAPNAGRTASIARRPMARSVERSRRFVFVTG